MSDALLRQWNILRMIPRGNKITATEIHAKLRAAGFDVSKRTVERDLSALSVAFAIESDERNTPYGWRWKGDMPPLDFRGLTTPEALAFRLLDEHSRHLLPSGYRQELEPYFKAARQRLESEAGEKGAAAWTRAVRIVEPNQPLLPPPIDETVRAAVSDALLLSRHLEVVYQAIDRQPSAAKAVSPLGLVGVRGILYLVVVFDGFEDVRTLALHRIRKAELLPEPAVKPEGFDLDGVIADGLFGFGELGHRIQIRLLFRDHAGNHLLESPLSEDQIATSLGPGEVSIEASVPLTRRLRWWLSNFGPDVEVLGPPELRDEMAQRLKRAAERYEGEKR
ncbi:WYL domain-containing protein [Paraburkholderia sp. BL17N1]|uniref:helix-turn-helix transcriptional regulator n=1 Tax=Paraburkholderia sp. BL17N1 TaxID=1938798 RepID=UPI000F1414BB|nr:WYL domain-containing protein [Paraburkholderia sp. BL17N1]RKR45955.1 putative DNA-binding transcriptional regulator YafY [Paraburkholderia sp. BL17N1]